MDIITTALLAVIAATLVTIAIQQHRRNVRQRPLERLAVAEERKRTARAIEHLEHDLGWLDSLTADEPPTPSAGAPRRAEPLEQPADPVEPTVETRLDDQRDQLYIVGGPIGNPTVTDLRRGVHLEFRDLSFGTGMELVVDATSRTAHVQDVDHEAGDHRVNVFHKIAIETAVWNDPDAAAEQYADRLDRRNRDAGVSIERNGKGDVTITTDPEPLPEGKTAIVNITDEDVETVAIVDTAALEAAADRYTRVVGTSVEAAPEPGGPWAPILPSDLDLEPVAQEDDPPLEDCPGMPGKPRCCSPGGCIQEVADAQTKALPGTCDWKCPTPCVTHADPEAVNGRHPDGTRRCRTESCNGSPEPRKAWCAACLAETPPANPVQDACDALAGELHAAKETADVDEGTAPGLEPFTDAQDEALAEDDQEGALGRVLERRAAEGRKLERQEPKTETGLPGPRIRSSSAAPLPTASGLATAAPRTVPPGDNPVPDGWVSAKDALAIIGCTQPPLGKKLAAGEIPGKKHPARNRHGFIWIIERATCEAVRAEFAETGKLRVPV